MFLAPSFITMVHSRFFNVVNLELCFHSRSNQNDDPSSNQWHQSFLLGVRALLSHRAWRWRHGLCPRKAFATGRAPFASAVRSKKWKLSATHGDMQTYLLIESATKNHGLAQKLRHFKWVCLQACLRILHCHVSMFPCFVGLKVFLKMFGPRNLW